MRRVKQILPFSTDKIGFLVGFVQKNAHISAELKILSLIYHQFLRQSVANANCFMGEAYAI